uniref:PiggyBac transposable element-derived protein domain-containing protein n=1 Tax=Myotis myotis TaxID=51298 RepID=A0A7J7UPR5_MYOMY|nr:hypothetical protein mMyoMyo1_008684 [Myotis myotis]
MPSLRKRKETKETDTLPEVFNDNLSDIPSEIKDADDCFDDSGDNSTNSTDSENIRPVRMRKVGVLSSDSDTDEATDNCWSEIDTPPRLQMFEGHAGVTTFPSQCDSVPSVTNLFFGDELFEMLCKELSNYHDQTAMKRKTPSRTLKWSLVTQKDFKKFLGIIILMGQTRNNSLKDYWSTDPLL